MTLMWWLILGYFGIGWAFALWAAPRIAITRVASGNTERIISVLFVTLVWPALPILWALKR